MLKIITLICALAGLLTALSLESWIRSRIVRNEVSAGTFAELKNRNREFWSIQYLPLAIMTVLIGAAIFVFVGHLNAAVFLGGAVLCLLSVVTGSLTVVSGSISSSSAAVSGDIRTSLKTAYRSASVMGLSVSSIALVGLGALFLFLDTDQLIKLIASFALGASLVSLCTGISGTAFSGAYSLTVKSDDFTDYTGMFIGSGADLVETYILSACSAALLADVGVNTSGVLSTFTASSAARYPLIVLASGIAASIIGIMLYRGKISKNPTAGLTAGNITAAVIIIAVSAFFSNVVLQSYVYAVCVAAGILAVLVTGEASKAYSVDGIVFRRNMPEARKAVAGQSMIYSLSIGMMSVIIPVAFTGVALIISYYFANYYGMALAAVGINSMAAINSTVRGFSINTASASEIVSASEEDTEGPTPADVLLTASVRTDVIGKTYSAVSTAVTLVAMYCALSIVGNSESANILTTSAFFGMIVGAVSVFIAGGLIIRSIKLTSVTLRDKLDDIYNDEKNITFLRGLVPLYFLSILAPFAAGFGGGINGLIAFACACTITGMCILFTFNNSGKYFDRMATETIGTVLKIMVAFTLVFAPFFNSIGGVF